MCHSSVKYGQYAGTDVQWVLACMPSHISDLVSEIFILCTHIIDV